MNHQENLYLPEQLVSSELVTKVHLYLPVVRLPSPPPPDPCIPKDSSIPPPKRFQVPHLLATLSTNLQEKTSTLLKEVELHN